MIDKTTFSQFGMSEDQYREVLSLFNRWRSEIDPLCGPAKKVSFIPQKVPTLPESS